MSNIPYRVMIPDLGPPIESLRIDVGGRIYQPVRLLKADESVISTNPELIVKERYPLTFRELIERAKKWKVNLGEDDLDHILEHSNEIPDGLQKRKIRILFTDYIFEMTRYGGVIYIYWDGDQWEENNGRYWSVCKPLSLIYALRRIK